MGVSAEAGTGSVAYTLSRLDGSPVDAAGVYLVLRLDTPENDLERLVATIFANLTRNRALAEAISERLVRIPAPTPGGAHKEGRGAGFATGDTGGSAGAADCPGGCRGACLAGGGGHHA